MDEHLDELSHAILSCVSDDYEFYEWIVEEVSTLNPRPTKDQIDSALIRLGGRGLLRAYHLSSCEPHVTDMNIPECDLQQAYFYATPEGRKLQDSPPCTIL